MKTLFYIKGRDDRSNLKTVTADHVTSPNYLHTADEVIEELTKDDTYKVVVLDDSFDSIDDHGDPEHSGPTVVEILRKIQTGEFKNPSLLPVVVLRPNQDEDETGITSDVRDITQEDRKATYAELGCFLTVEKPFTVSSLEEDFKEISSSYKNPPQWLRALREVHKFIFKKQFKSALLLISKLEEAGISTDDLGFSLCKSTAQWETGNKEEAMQILRTLELEYPRSISIKEKLLKNLMDSEEFDDAFEEQLQILYTQKSVYNFHKSLEIFQIIFEKRLEASEEAGSQFALDALEQMLGVFDEDPPQYSRQKRCDLFSQMSKRLSSAEDWKRMIESMQRYEDITESIIDLYQTGLDKIHPLISEDDQCRILYNKTHLKVLECQPEAPQSIEVAADYLLANQKIDELDKILVNATRAGADSLEFYISSAKLHLYNENLREASDVLHKAVQIQADDERVMTLRAEWKEAYAAKNSG